MKNYVSSGRTLSVPAPHAVSGGEVVVLGTLAGVAVHSANLGEQVEIETEGVFDLVKTSAQAWTVGAPIYVTPDTGVCTTASTAGNLLMGTAVAAAASPSATGRVRLNGSAPAARTT